MIGEYSLSIQGKSVGSVSVSKEGLYFLIKCVCTLPDSDRYYLWAHWDDKTEKIGICVPASGDYRLVARYNSKKAGKGNCRFELRTQKSEENCIVIREKVSLPYDYLRNLPHLRLRILGEDLALTIKKDP